MGKDARAGAQKTVSDAEKRRILGELAEEQRGELQERGVHSGRCPKCGGDKKALRLTHCPGYDERMENFDAAPADICRLVGEHMHGTCERSLGGCGFGWREKCADAGRFE